MPAKLLQTDERPVTEELCRALVERVASSAELRRAARLRAFLLYVCDQTLSRRNTVIHEQEIGSAVFERPLGYDTSVDNIVRVNATELRKRLEHFFAGEGQAEEFILEIQRGSYTPTFRRRTVEKSPQIPVPDSTLQSSVVTPLTGPAWDGQATVTPTGRSSSSASPDAEAASKAPAGRGVHNRVGVWQAMCALLLVVCGAFAWQLHSLSLKVLPSSHDPAIRAFWSEFLEAGSDTDILLADTSFAVAEDILQRQITLPDYLNYNYKRMAEDPSLPEARRSDLARVLERNNGSNADFQVGAQILSLDKDRHRFTLGFARSYSPEEAKRHNLILIGSRQSNPWVSLFAGKMNFDLEYDPAVRRPYVVNRAPQADEARQYPAPERPDPVGTGYAVIAFMPDLSGKGRTLIIEGTDSQATGGAGDFITSDDALSQLQKKFAGKKIPYFEVLLRTSQVSGTPLHGEVIAYRIYPGGDSK